MDGNLNKKLNRAHMQILLTEACIIVDDHHATEHAYCACRHLAAAINIIRIQLGHERRVYKTGP